MRVPTLVIEKRKNNLIQGSKNSNMGTLCTLGRKETGKKKVNRFLDSEKARKERLQVQEGCNSEREGKLLNSWKKRVVKRGKGRLRRG